MIKNLKEEVLSSNNTKAMITYCNYSKVITDIITKFKYTLADLTKKEVKQLYATLGISKSELIIGDEIHVIDKKENIVRKDRNIDMIKVLSVANKIVENRN